MTLLSRMPGVLGQQGASGPSPASFVFDGTRHFLGTEGVAALAGASRDLTVTCWAKLATPIGSQAFMSVFAITPTAVQRKFTFYTRPDNNYQTILQVANDAGAAVTSGFSNTGLVSIYGAWRFLAARVDSASVRDGFIDATKIGGTAYADLNAVSNQPVRIGASNGGTLPLKNGTKLFNPTLTFGALSDAQITEIRNGDLSSTTLRWETKSDFDGTTLVCNNPTYNVIATGAGIVADPADVP